jgi:hypothetical protein
VGSEGILGARNEKIIILCALKLKEYALRGRKYFSYK